MRKAATSRKSRTHNQQWNTRLISVYECLMWCSTSFHIPYICNDKNVSWAPLW